MSLLDSEIEIIDKVSIKDLIIEWLKKYKITDYKINDDITIDANGRVDLNGYPEPQLPDYIQFNIVNGCFNISYSQIKTLKGCPKIVNSNFFCHHCKNLKSLEGAPEKVKKGFYCVHCDSLKSLKGAPEIVDGGFYCSYCDKLESFEGTPNVVKGNFICTFCHNLKITESDYKKYKIIK